MHRLAEIKLTHFRNFSQASFSFPSVVTGITGANGMGKTNLLDAVYYLCFTKSYFQNKEINNVQNGQQGFRLEGTWIGLEPKQSGSRTVCKWKDGRKTVAENDVEYEKIATHIGKYSAVMIAPDDLAIVNEGSELRRKFMDGLLAQSNPEYLQELLQYYKVLAQRNACLKMLQPNHQLLDVYDQKLSEHGRVLVQARQELTVTFPSIVQKIYTALSADKELTQIGYRICAEPNQLAATISGSRAKDLEARRTLQGPHTEDWLFTLDGNSLKTSASQGQKKSFLISLKLAQVQWLQQLGKAPILLLDDIFEKLDKHRLARFFSLISRQKLPQILMTHTEPNDIQQLVSPYFPELGSIKL